jgi:hypothetical protein
MLACAPEQAFANLWLRITKYDREFAIAGTRSPAC